MSTIVDRHPTLEVVPLGGLGEFGMNTMLVGCGETSILVDAGVMFPGPDSFGVDLVIPDLSHLRQTGRRLSALVLTHGHEDHIGGVPYVWNMLDGPVYGTPLTLALLEPKLEEHDIQSEGRLTPVSAGETVGVGPLEIEFIHVTHSMPGCTALAIHSPAGTIVHTGDYKFDQTPAAGDAIDTRRLAELGRSGVLALFGDSTNAERQGFTGSETDVVATLEDLFTSTQGKLVVATFASSLHRLQLLVDLAAQCGRKVALVGRGIVRNVGIASRLGCLTIPPGLQIDETDVASHPPGQVLCLVTGSQGEPFAALSRIAVDHHRHVKLQPQDVVVFSARAIPGNQRAIGRLMDHISRRGAEVIHEGDRPVHVSGHGSVEELKLMLTLVRPSHFVPIHGEYRYLVRHARVAEAVTGGRTSVFVLENGDRLCFDAAGAWRGEAIPTGRILIDGTRTGEVVDEVLRERRRLAGDGVVVLVLVVDKQAGVVVGEPTVITRGVVTEPRTEALPGEIQDVVSDVIASTSHEELSDGGVVQERIRVELQRFFRKRSGHRPLVLPVVMEM
jgi:ribonuclease J